MISIIFQTCIHNSKRKGKRYGQKKRRFTRGRTAYNQFIAENEVLGWDTASGQWKALSEEEKKRYGEKARAENARRDGIHGLTEEEREREAESLGIQMANIVSSKYSVLMICLVSDIIVSKSIYGA